MNKWLASVWMVGFTINSRDNRATSQLHVMRYIFGWWTMIFFWALNRTHYDHWRPKQIKIQMNILKCIYSQIEPKWSFNKFLNNAYYTHYAEIQPKKKNQPWWHKRQKCRIYCQFLVDHVCLLFSIFVPVLVPMFSHSVLDFWRSRAAKEKDKRKAKKCAVVVVIMFVSFYVIVRSVFEDRAEPSISAN